MSFGLLALKDFLVIWLSNILSLSVPDEGYYVPDEGYYVPDEGYINLIETIVIMLTLFQIFLWKGF
jgi:hypothetical protein